MQGLKNKWLESVKHLVDTRINKEYFLKANKRQGSVPNFVQLNSITTRPDDSSIFAESVRNFPSELKLMTLNEDRNLKSIPVRENS